MVGLHFGLDAPKPPGTAGTITDPRSRLTAEAPRSFLSPAGGAGDQFLVFHAQHLYYRPLLEAGVRIYLYPGPSILHAKHMSVDELVTVVGSSSTDIRSCALDLELSLVTCGRGSADEMRRVEDEYQSLSRKLPLQEWMGRAGGRGLVDDLARLTSAVQ